MAGVFVTKEMSGYSTDRIYVFQGGNNIFGFASIDVADDGTVGSTWSIHANTPAAQFRPHDAFSHGKYIFWYNSDGNLYRWEFPSTATDTGSWEIVDQNYFRPESEIGDLATGVLNVHDHLCNRVKVTENSTNTYWFVSDDKRKRVVVVVKDADGNYNYIYGLNSQTF